MLEQKRDSNQDEESDCLAVEITGDISRHMRNIRTISNRLIEMLSSEPEDNLSSELIENLTLDLKQLNEKISILSKHSDLILWLEIDGEEKKLCAIPKNLDKQLYRDIWSKGIPTILTSGTLSANENFSHIKRTLGLERAEMRLTQTSKPSPFDFQKNAMIYISENVPFPNQSDREYIAAVARETERLIHAAHGHTAVLFTSYKAMDMVCERLSKRQLPFPMFRMEKSDPGAIDKFKQSKNGVLFASGAMWEGIDIPGDILSLVVIVKLPFAVPDPISEYEQTSYKNMEEYKRRVIIPDMQIKYKQGRGRLLRTESDNGVIAILDCRAMPNCIYHEAVIQASPVCQITNRISDVEEFLRAVKPQEYWE